MKQSSFDEHLSCVVSCTIINNVAVVVLLHMTFQKCEYRLMFRMELLIKSICGFLINISNCPPRSYSNLYSLHFRIFPSEMYKQWMAISPPSLQHSLLSYFLSLSSFSGEKLSLCNYSHLLYCEGWPFFWAILISFSLNCLCPLFIALLGC